LSELCTGRLGAAYDEVEVAHQSMLILMGLGRFVRRATESGPPRRAPRASSRSP
jgi:hypothetical protein